MTYGIEPGTGPALLLGWLARPYDPVEVTAALLGLSPRVSRQLMGTLVATSQEAEDLLEAMPTIVRSLAIATTDRPQRCYAEIRGPVLWSETMAARGASAGDPGLFVCASPTRAYDTEENRVLRAALHAVQVAGRQAELGPDGSHSAIIRRARHNGQRAARLLDHQTLAQVPTTRPTGRELRRTRAGSRRHTYRPALTMLARVAEPLAPSHLSAFAGERTRAQLDLLAAVLARLAEVTGMPAVVRCESGDLVGGPVSFHHPAHQGPPGPWDGVRIRNLLVDVPDPLGADPRPARAALEERAAGAQTELVLDAEDVGRAVARALG